MTLTFKFDLDMVKMNKHAKYLVQKSFTVVKSHCSDTQTHRETFTQDKLLCLDQKSDPDPENRSKKSTFPCSEALPLQKYCNYPSASF